jgi:hypothetical protein
MCVTLHGAHILGGYGNASQREVHSLPARIKAFAERRIKRKRAACKGNEFLVQE